MGEPALRRQLGDGVPPPDSAALSQRWAEDVGYVPGTTVEEALEAALGRDAVTLAVAGGRLEQLPTP
ncbi:MAG: hypothetical protein GX605_13455 [Chloroflexi bacterium]|nr:hypothetical protein [Chloroflexota bacterium]